MLKFPEATIPRFGPCLIFGPQDTRAKSTRLTSAAILTQGTVAVAKVSRNPRSCHLLVGQLEVRRLMPASLPTTSTMWSPLQ